MLLKNVTECEREGGGIRKRDEMNKVRVWNDSADNPFNFEMDDRELREFCGFMHPQEVTDVFEHEENGIMYFIIKSHISLMSYTKEV